MQVAFVSIVKILVLLACWPAAAVEGGRRSEFRVMGGRDANPSEFPYVLRMEIQYKVHISGHDQTRYRQVCTAAALSPTWMLTAAHCISGMDSRIKSLHSLYPQAEEPRGIVREVLNEVVSPQDQISDIVDTIPHPSFRMSLLLYNDVGLLKTMPFKLPRYGKLSSVDASALLGQAATVVGFGITRADEAIGTTLKLGKLLQVTDVVIKKCDSGMPLLIPKMCISSRCGKKVAVCGGDSGGPLIHASGIVGINTQAKLLDCMLENVDNEVNSNLVALITPISSFTEWITDQIRKDL